DLISARIEDEGTIVYFWKHRYAVLACLAKTFGQADMMLDKRVVALSLYEADPGTAYLETACRTVEFPGSPAEAAKALNVHRNTYFYRVNKIAELFLLDLKRGEDRLAVAFSTRFMAGMGNQMLYDVDHMPEAWRRSFERTERD
ncbi:MAG: helix-turn-helix domain-containing protein, partial [Atopobiaceae bacterium]|nr:helix-turn-helix domain-containing protein [Atopobiaceae bacterium]